MSALWSTGWFLGGWRNNETSVCCGDQQGPNNTFFISLQGLSRVSYRLSSDGRYVVVAVPNVNDNSGWTGQADDFTMVFGLHQYSEHISHLNIINEKSLD